VQNGFIGVTQQIAGLQFVNNKDFQEFKDRTTAGQFELQKAIDFLKKDLETLRKDTDANRSQIDSIQARIIKLETLKSAVNPIAAK
jgi:hypothetical protein